MNEPEPVLEIVICTYNNAACLRQALERIAEQTVGGAAVPVLIVDNNCTDDTKAVADSFAARLPLLRYTFESQQGASHARRRGVMESTARWIGFIDDDNYIGPDWYERATTFIASHDHCGAFGGKNVITWEKPPHPLLVECAFAYAKLDLGADEKLLTGQLRWKLCGAGLVVRRTAIIAAGITDWMFSTGRTSKEAAAAGEDTEIVARVARLGWEIWFQPACVLHHFIAESRISIPYLARLQRGFGIAEPMLRGMMRQQSYLEWLVRMLVRIAVLALRVVRLIPRALVNEYGRAKLHVWLAYLFGMLTGVRAVFRLSPEERRLWLGQSIRAVPTLTR